FTIRDNCRGINFVQPNEGDWALPGEQLQVHYWFQDRVDPGQIIFRVVTVMTPDPLVTKRVRYRPRDPNEERKIFSTHISIPDEVSYGNYYIQAEHIKEGRITAHGNSPNFTIQPFIEDPEDDSTSSDAHLRIRIMGDDRLFHYGETIRARMELIGGEDIPGFDPSSIVMFFLRLDVEP
ncbi:MAG: hypothetical protein R6V58_11845, partial [Planctomycetota bacterium]